MSSSPSSRDTAMMPRDMGLSNSVSSLFLMTPCLVTITTNWQARALLVALNLQLGFAGHFRRGDLDRNLALDVFVIRFRLCRVGSFCGAHVLPFTNRCIR